MPHTAAPCRPVPRHPRGACLLRVALVGALALPLAGCLTGGGTRNVLFGEAAARAVWPDSGDQVVRVYYDRNGALYPAGSPGVPDAAVRSLPREVSLAAYYRPGAPGASAWPAVRSRAGVHESGSFDAEWRVWQDRLRSTVADSLNRLLDVPGAAPKTLVVLVHGFNVEDGEEQLGAARRRIAREFLPDGRAVYLQVSWDGNRSEAGAPAVAWFAAQYNAPLVGLELRRLLAAVDPRVPVRVVSHSLGALVVANALWDARAVFTPQDLAKDSTYRAYSARAAGADPTYAFPRPASLRVGMLAPATSGLLFANLSQEAGRAAPIDRLVLGVNRADNVLRKVVNLPGVGGATSLGLREHQYCDQFALPLRTRFRGGARVVEFFDETRDGAWNREHSWVRYTERAAAPTFLALLFRDDASMGTTVSDERRLCKLSP